MSCASSQETSACFWVLELLLSIVYNVTLNLTLMYMWDTLYVIKLAKTIRGHLILANIVSLLDHLFHSIFVLFRLDYC
jgi:hypothetical protein